MGEKYRNTDRSGRERKIETQTEVGRERVRIGGREKSKNTDRSGREGDSVGERKIETQTGLGEREKDSSTDRSGRERERKFLFTF